jgi:hypothetical protein
VPVRCWVAGVVHGDLSDRQPRADCSSASAVSCRTEDESIAASIAEAEDYAADLASG